MATNNRGLVAFTPNGTIGDDYFAGEYFWYSIKEEMLPLHRVRTAFGVNGLDESRLPAGRRPEHVAQEACRRVERVTHNGHREQIRAEQVLRTASTIVYQITVHVQDKANQVVDHPKALRVTYRFDKSELVFEPLGGVPQSEVQHLVDEISAHYEQNHSHIPGHKLRTLIRQYVEEAGAESMRGGVGGIYFMAKRNELASWSKLRPFHGPSIDGREFVERLRMTLEELYGTAPNFHAIPCINDEGQREFLKRKFIENCADDLREYRDACIELVQDNGGRGRAPRSDTVTRMVQRRQEIDMRRAKFASILGEALGELDQNMLLADNALSAFLQAADAA